MADTKLYDLLGVSKNAGDSEIKKVYALKFHHVNAMLFFYPSIKHNLKFSDGVA